MFEHVLIPYNRLLGRRKKYDSLLGYGESARTHFTQWLDSSGQFSEIQHSTVMYVFDRWLDILEENRRREKRAWKNAELVWLPLQYGVKSEQYDSREELNQTLEQILGESFSDGNQVFYVIDEQFQPEVSRMILEAKDYHVLWIHDYRGKNSVGDPDSVSFRQVLTYLQALTKAVQEYDSRGRMPVYLIVIDQYFYSLTKGEFWLALLQNPLKHRLRLPAKYREWSEQLDAAQETLRNAVAASKRLQAETKTYGKKWIDKTVKVHVNVTNPADYSFLSAQVIPDKRVSSIEISKIQIEFSAHPGMPFKILSRLIPGISRVNECRETNTVKV